MWKNKSLGRAEFFLLIKDDAFRYRLVYFLKEKSGALDYMTNLIHIIHRDIGNYVKKLRIDRGGEFQSKEITKFITENEIIHETSTAYIPQQNGYVEREN